MKRLLSYLLSSNYPLLCVHVFVYVGSGLVGWKAMVPLAGESILSPASTQDLTSELIENKCLTAHQDTYCIAV